VVGSVGKGRIVLLSSPAAPPERPVVCARAHNIKSPLARPRACPPPPPFEKCRQIPRRHRRIGLLGGSFNPAHGGHLHLSLLAVRHLALDEVWWLVSPQNPFKPVAGIAPFAPRGEPARPGARPHPPPARPRSPSPARAPLH